VNADRLAAARECARRYHAAVVLKGAGTVVAYARERAPWIAAYAEPALGVAGSGDVLTGAIAARLAERGGGEDFDARVLEAVLAHGRAGERVRAALGSSRGALAHEIADALPAALEQS
jgi:NAD(P)H-hydrate epimerase